MNEPPRVEHHHVPWYHPLIPRNWPGVKAGTWDRTPAWGKVVIVIGVPVLFVVAIVVLWPLLHLLGGG